LSSVKELQESVMILIDKHNKESAPLYMHQISCDILKKVKRGAEKLNKLQTV